MGQKTNFLAHFEIFCLCPLTPWVTPQFLSQMKGLTKIYNCGRFHLYSICGCQVINVQMLLRQCSTLDIVPFGFFGGLFLPQVWIDLAELSADVVPHKINSVFEEISKFSFFLWKVCTQNLEFWPILGPDLPLENPK